MRHTWLVAGLLIAACSSESAEENEQGVLYDAAQMPLDKVEAIEATLLESAEKRDEAIEESRD
jgi:hypothetical protein